MQVSRIKWLAVCETLIICNSVIPKKVNEIISKNNKCFVFVIWYERFENDAGKFVSVLDCSDADATQLAYKRNVVSAWQSFIGSRRLFCPTVHVITGSGDQLRSRPAGSRVKRRQRDPCSGRVRSPIRLTCYEIQHRDTLIAVILLT